MERNSLLGLATRALRVVSRIATELSGDKSRCKLALLGARLLVFVTQLPNPKNELNCDQSVVGNLHKILEEVEKACTWPKVNDSSSLRTLRALSQSRNNGRSLCSWLTNRFSRTRLEEEAGKCLKSYCSNERFTHLLNLLEGTTTLKEGQPVQSNHGSDSGSANQDEAAVNYPARVHRELHEVLCIHVSACTCQVPCQHSTRLRLKPRDKNQLEDAFCFEFLFSMSDKSIQSSPRIEWQETRISVPSSLPILSSQPSFAGLQKKLVEGQFCGALYCTEETILSFTVQHPYLIQLVDRNESLTHKVEAMDSISLTDFFKISKMSKKARCILAYTLAKSVWQFYGSEWMKHPWTRDSIHLLHDQRVERDSNIWFWYLRPYFVPSFEGVERGIPEFNNAHVGRHIFHRYPMVLALGILLIEVAKWRPLKLPHLPLDYVGASVNEYWKHARSTLKKKGAFDKMEDFTQYRKAVDSCLTPDLFLPVDRSLGEQSSEEILKKKRDIIYTQIVHPLKRLLEGTGWWTEADEIKQQLSWGLERPSSDMLKFFQTETLQTPNLGNMNGQLSSFGGNSKLTSASWIKEFAVRSESFSHSNSTSPIRIAVLDTGCNPDAPIFCDPSQENRLKNHWHDWVEGTFEPQDEDGHGTEIVSILLRILPTAEIFVARVSRNQNRLHNACESIAEAIKHAATQWMVDIITMSFGFHSEVPQIRDAILEVERTRKRSVIFFAAAANEGANTEELFPANFDSVISVRGTDCAGAFVPHYDPAEHQSSGNMPLYGTLGKDVPWDWPDEDELSSGCSIAAPIAAGIAALIIQCVESSPDDFVEGGREMIRTKQAIMEVFYRISVDQGRNRRYIAPWKLFAKDHRSVVAIIRVALDNMR